MSEVLAQLEKNGSSGGTGTKTVISAHADQFGSVYFDISIYDSSDVLLYTAPRINWNFSRGSHRGVNGNININAVDVDNISVTNNYSVINL